MTHLMLNGLKSYQKHFLMLHFVFLVGYTILLFGSWALFIVGGIFLIPIFSGLVDTTLASVRDENLSFKNLFKYFKRYHKGPAIAHTLVVANIHLVLLSTFLIFYQIFGAVIPRMYFDNSIIATAVILLSALPYIILGTYFSLTSFIIVDNNIALLHAVKTSIMLVKPNIFRFTLIRVLFFYRNSVLFGVVATRCAYHFNISDTPNQLSGQSAMIMIVLWIGVLILTTPLYETLRAHMYLYSIQNKNDS
ncbi:MAG: hypothetical protein ACOCU1_00490 [Bacillota bacterium]